MYTICSICSLKKIAQSCRSGNKAKFAYLPTQNTVPSKNLILITMTQYPLQTTGLLWNQICQNVWTAEKHYRQDIVDVKHAKKLQLAKIPARCVSDDFEYIKNNLHIFSDFIYPRFHHHHSNTKTHIGQSRSSYHLMLFKFTSLRNYRYPPSSHHRSSEFRSTVSNHFNNVCPDMDYFKLTALEHTG